MTSQDEIEAMLARIAKGDRRAFRGLYDLISPQLFGICSEIVQDEQVALSALIDAFEEIWMRAGQVRANGVSPLAWLICLTRNVAVVRRGEVASRSEEPDAEYIGIAERLYKPELSNVQSDNAQQLGLCFSELPPDHAGLFRRAFLSGASYADFARQSGASQRSIRVALRRSVLQLRDCLSR